jgi:hypothetical protein
MWLNVLWRRWFGRTRPFPHHIHWRRTDRRRLRIAPRLEVLEDRRLLSAPGDVLLGSNGTVSVPATSQGGQVSGTYFLGSNFNVSGSVGGVTGSDPTAFGAKLNLNVSGNVGLDLGYSASAGGQVSASYQGVNLQQNYLEPTQFGQEVLFTPQNTNVAYTGGSFSTTGPSASVSAGLEANVGGSVGGTIAFFKSYSGSTNFNLSVNQPLISIGVGSDTQSNDLGLMLNVLGQDISSQINQLVQDGHLSLTVTPFGPEIPVIVEGDVSGSTNPLSLHEALQAGVGEGEGDEAIGGLKELGSMDEFIPDLTLNSNSLQNGGVLTSSAQGSIADLNIQAGALLGPLDTNTLTIGPAFVSFTPVSFQIGPDLTLAQSGTVTPTSQLVYQFSTPVDVTKDGTDLGLVSSVAFTPGMDNIGIKFTGAPITVTPTWNFGLNYTNELDLDVNVQGTLTAGEASVGAGPVSSPPLGPLYQQTWNFANYKVATLYGGTSSLYSTSQTLPSFTIGSTFSPSLDVKSFQDSVNPTDFSLRDAVLTANLPQNNTSTSPQQIIHLGPGTYNLTIASNSSGQGTSGGLYVTAQNLMIEGAGLGQTIINASGLGDRNLDVAAGANLTLEGVTIAGGTAGANQNGGGILNSGTLTLINSSLSGNSAFVGGAIENDGILTIEDSTISDNASSEAAGAIDNFVGAALTIGDSTISDNAAGGFGGGITNGGTLTIDDSTISGNRGSYLGGGGVYNSEFGTATISNSTIAGNTAIPSLGITVGGGGVFNSGVLTIANSTISANLAGFNALIPEGGVGGGIYTPSPSSRPNMVTNLYNTIVAGNSLANSVFNTEPSDINGTVSNVSANNLIGDGDGASGIANGINGNLVGQQNALIDPKLAPLGNYGGPTETMALLPGSLAIDAGANTVPGGLPLTDQRGFVRTINGQVDIGAVEYQYDLGLSGSVAPGTTPGTVQYSYTVANNGPDPVVGATLTVPLPQGTTFLSQTLPTGWTETDPGTGNNGTIVFTDTSNLESGQSANFAVTVQLQNTTTGALLANTATVGPAAWDDNLPNNSLTLTVANEQEGQTFSKVLLYHFTDANTKATANDFTASVTWGDSSSNASNDGSGMISVVADPNGGFDVVGTHSYAEEGNYAITVSVTGLDGTQLSSSSQQLFVVADAPLTAGALTPPPNATINQAITSAVLFHFTDADPNGTASDYTATVTWGDGTSNNSGDGTGNVSVVANSAGGFNVIGSHTYTQILKSGTFTVQVSDGGGASTSASDSNFQALAPDQPLTAGALNVPSVTTEGQSIGNQVLFHFSDADPNAQVSDYLATVTWGDGSSNKSNDTTGSVSVVANANGGFDVIGSHTFRVSSGIYFAVKVTDLGDPRSAQPDLGGQTTGAVSSAPLTITDPPVAVTAGPTFKDIENTLSAVQTVATFTDPGGPEATSPNPAVAPYIATIQWGDGTVTVASLTTQANYTNATVNSQGQISGSLVSAENVGGIVLGSDGKTFSVNLAHQYATEGNYAITVLLNHDGVLSPTVTTNAIAAGNDRLTATAGSAISSTFGAGISNATVATFTDTNTASTASEFTATIAWGDGQSSTGAISGGDGSFTVTGSHNYASVGNYPIGVTITNFGATATATTNTSATITQATPTVKVADASGTYNGQTFAATATVTGVSGTAASTLEGVGLVYDYQQLDANGNVVADLGNNAPVNAGSYRVTASFAGSTDYTSASASTTFTISPAPLTATAVSVSAIAGAPFSGIVADFTSTASMGAASDFTAAINWGDGSTSNGVIGGSGSTFTVIGSHTYAAAGIYTIQVTISQVVGDMTTATVNDTATVSNLGQTARPDQMAGIGFWHNKHGQALIDSFNGGANSTALSTWLATTFANLFGAGAGANNLTGLTNAEVAAFYESQFEQHGPKVEADVLATALNVYATTLSLGGTAAEAYGFSVTADGLGADSVNVGHDGAAFGVANNTTLNVYQLLLAANGQAVNGVLYNGNATLQKQADQVFGDLS